MAIKNSKNSILLQNGQSWFTASLFTWVISYFLLRLLGFSHPPMLSLILPIGLFCAIFGLGFHFWKWSLPVCGILALLVGIQILGGFDLRLPLLSQGFWRSFLNAVRESLRWAITLNPSKGAIPNHFLLCFTMVTSFLSVISHWILPIPLLNMAVLIAPMFYIGDLNRSATWIIMLLTGLFCIYCSYAFRQDPDNRDQRPPLLFGLILVLCTFLLQAIIPPETFYHQSISKKLNEFIPTEGGEIRSFSLQELGFYPQGNLRVGGPVTLSDETYLYVNGEETAFYLKGASYDSFDGHSWSLSSQQILQPFHPKKNYYEDFTSPIAKNFWFKDKASMDKAFQTGMFVPKIYSIQTVNPNRIVFHGGKPGNVTQLGKLPPNGMKPDKAQAEYGTGAGFLYSNNGMLVSEEYYNQFGAVLLDHVVPVINNWQTPQGTIPMTLLQPKKSAPKSALRKTVEKGDPALAKILYQEEHSSFSDLLLALRDHFQKNYQYELQVSEIPDTEDFLSHFLKEKKGYCVYFASCWSLLLEDIGYHTRYTEGFIVPQAPAGKQEVIQRAITAKQAHAWVELETEDMGWYPIEATPSSHVTEISGVDPEGTGNNKPQESQSQTSQEAVASSESTSSTPEESSQSSEFQPEEPNVPDLSDSGKDKDAGSAGKSTLWIFGIVILITIVILCFILWKYRSYKRRLDASSLATFPDKNELFRRVWKHCKRLLRLHGVSIEAKDSIRQILQNLAVRDHKPMADYQDLAQTLEKMVYGEAMATDEDFQQLHSFYKELEESYQSEVSRITFWRKDILQAKGRPW